MADTTCLASDPTTVTISWIASRGIEICDYSPDGGASKPSPDHPVLYLVDPGIEPPRCSELEDWIRRPIDLDELHARADHLLASARRVGAALVRISEDDTLHVGDAIVILSDLDVRLMTVLLEHLGDLVLRDDLAAAVWPDDPPSDRRALDNRVKSLRKRIAGVPLELHTVWGRGFLLEQTATS